MDHFRKNCSEYFSQFIILAVIICFVIMNDTGTTAAIRFLAVVFSVSFFMRPYLPSNRMRYADAGFGLSFGLGLFLCFYTAWFISAIGLCEYSYTIAYVSFFLFAAGGFLIRKYINRRAYITHEELVGYFNGFAVFAVIFLLLFWIIGFNPLVDSGTENYMDFGFMQTIWRQKSAIPKDIWFSGTTLNYYYLGQSACVYMCRLAHVTPEYGYNLMLITFTGMVFLMSAELAYGIFNALSDDFKFKRVCGRIGGIAAGTMAAFGANPHWLIHGIIMPVYGKIAHKDVKEYWIADGTVYIRQELGDPDNGKNEFPAYSVILGDLHAHVINVIFVLPLVAILFDLVLSDDPDKDKDKLITPVQVCKLMLISMLLGYYKGANYWDFAIYYVITGAVIVFSDIERFGINIRTFAKIAIKAVMVTVVSIVIILPFSLNFIKMESGIGICEAHSPLGKLAELWLIPVLFAVGLIIYLYREKPAGIVINNNARVSVLAFVLCTIGLVITPEVIYVKDIYGEANRRFNTMFKLTYQAFVLFAVIFGIFVACMCARIALQSKHAALTGVLLGCSFLYCIFSVSYMVRAVHQRYGDITQSWRREGISSLDGLYYDEVYGFEMRAADILAEDDRPVINIVEAAGNSYTHESALSVYSGTCTPVGWFIHEWMWHNEADPVRERADEVAWFYTSGDEAYCRDFLKKYDVDYILVGPAEVCKYPVYRSGFMRYGDVLAGTEWQGVDLLFIKVDKSLL